MGNIWEDMVINFFFSILRGVVKNPQKKEDLKRVMLKIRNVINMTYADDDDFGIG